MGLGVSNFGAGLASGMVVNGSLSKTAVNGSAGAKSQVSSMTAAAWPCSRCSSSPASWSGCPRPRSRRHLWRVGTGAIARNHRITARADFVGALAALLGVLVLDTRPGLVIGIGVSLVLLIART